MSERARWDALSDALATDEALSEEELRLVEQLELDQDPAIARERSLYAELRQQGRPMAVVPEDRQRAQATLAEFRRRRAATPVIGSEPAPKTEPAGAPVVELAPRSRRGLAIGMGLGATLIAVAASLLLWVGLPGPTVMTLERPDAVITGGILMLDGVELGPGEGVPLGRWVQARTPTCVHAGRSRGCVGPGTRLRVHDDGFELSEGQLTLQGTASVQTPVAQLEAKDAALELRIDPEGVWVDAGTGTVIVHEPNEEPRTLAAGEHDRLGVVEPPPVPTDEVEPEVEVEPETEAEAEAEPEIPTPTTSSRSSRPSVTPAGELLSAARRHVAEGTIGKALAAYGALRRQHPRSPEAHAANVSIGELELRRGRPKAALEAFGRYLSRGGALAEEAHWGKIRALHRMGKTGRRDAAIEALRAAHPGSVYLARASKL